MEERNEKVVLTEIKDILSDWTSLYEEFDDELTLLDYDVVRHLLGSACSRFERINDKVAELIERDRFETDEKIEKLKAALEDEKKHREEAEKKLADVYAFAKIAQKQGGAFSWGFNGLEDSK